MPGYLESDTSWAAQELRTAAYVDWATQFTFCVPKSNPVVAQVVLRQQDGLIQIGNVARKTPRKVSIDQL